MAGTPESKVKAEVKFLLKKYNAYQHWPVQSGYGSPTLDCIGCHHGRYFAIETKTPGNRLTPRQEQTRASIINAGGVVFVVGEEAVFVDEGNRCVVQYSGIAGLEAWLLKLL